jgi:uncharacterized protein YyaL (SSP411 family)
MYDKRIDGNNKKNSNRLINETSPYLLQHAYNPVNWYPWGKDALEKARSEDKPIFLSIGYSSCHWCHVMAHESFEDEEIAKIMNENFVNIKVDREERADLDDVYQRVCQLAAGSGGWPLSVFLTPEQKPFYIGTYFPKSSRYGMPGFMSIVKQLADTYKNKKNEILSATSEFMRALSGAAGDVSTSRLVDVEPDRSILDEAAISLLQLGDPTFGGFGQAPKFPNPSNLMFMLRYYELSGISKFRDFVFFTADRMASGGIHDHLGGGFARYSTDQKWLVPHFEKMLYDNALLAQLFAEIYQVTSDMKYLEVLKKTIKYVLRDMTSPDGCFYSAEDADSEGEEGKFYLWTKREILEVLNNQTVADIFCYYYGVTEGGNFEGKNILNSQNNKIFLSQKFNKPLQVVDEILRDSELKLFEARKHRERPGKDDKIITSWNSLMISALVKAYRVSSEVDYLKAAVRAADFVEDRMSSPGGRLYRIFKNGNPKLNGYLDDYSFYVNSLIDLFEVYPIPRYLDRAIAHTDFMLDHFWDNSQNSGFFFTSDDHEELIIRTKNYYDLAIPSGNSMAALDLLRLYHFSQRNEYLKRSEDIFRSVSSVARDNPFGFGQLLISLYMYVKKPIEFTLVKGSETKEETFRKMLTLLNKTYIPNGIFAFVESGMNSAQLARLPFFRGKLGLIDSEADQSTRAYVCKNFACSRPMHTSEDLEDYIKSSSLSPD